MEGAVLEEGELAGVEEGEVSVMEQEVRAEVVPARAEIDLNVSAELGAAGIEIPPSEGNEVPNDDASVEMSMDSDEQNLRRAEIIDDAVSGRAKNNPLKRKLSSRREAGPSIEITYRRLPRQSQRKLQELLVEWAEWHSAQDFGDDVLEDGSETYFPALEMAADGSRMHFWMDKPSKRVCAEKGLEDRQGEVPLYDRAYSSVLQASDGILPLAGHLEIPEEAARCFNCGSYTHALKDCQRPRDYSAISSARKQHMLKRGPATPSRRYFQSSAGGKFDDIKPGVLRSEARQSLGIGENDPPPWLNRMRELGYPPGYLEMDDAEPSGLVMFGGENVLASTEDGEIIEAVESSSKSQRMTVEFPGINAPIPENADKKLWSSQSSRLSQNYSETRFRAVESRSSRANETLHRPSSDAGKRGTFRSLHPDDYLTPPGESDSYSSRHSASVSSRISMRERSHAWGLAQASLDSARLRGSSSRTGGK